MSFSLWAIPPENIPPGGDFFENPLKKPPEIFHFITLPLEIPHKTTLHPWKFHKIVLHPFLEIPNPISKNQDPPAGNYLQFIFPWWSPLEIPLRF